MEKLRTATNILVRTFSSFEPGISLVETTYLLLLEGMYPDTCSDAVLDVYKHMYRVLLPTCNRNSRRFCSCFGSSIFLEYSLKSSLLAFSFAFVISCKSQCFLDFPGVFRTSWCVIHGSTRCHPEQFSFYPHLDHPERLFQVAKRQTNCS